MFKRMRDPYLPQSNQPCWPCEPVPNLQKLPPVPSDHRQDSSLDEIMKLCGCAILAFCIWLLLPEKHSGQAQTASIIAPTPAKPEKAQKKTGSAVPGGSHSFAAAVTIEEILPADARGYVNRYAVYAQREMAKFSIPASVTLAQGILESSAGLSDVAIECSNHFGIKCFRDPHNGCCRKYKDDENKDSFRIFDNPKGSYRAHSKLLVDGKRYDPCFECGNDWACWAKNLQKAGYATDKQYAAKLVGAIKKMELWRFDGDSAYTPDDISE